MTGRSSNGAGAWALRMLAAGWVGAIGMASVVGAAAATATAGPTGFLTGPELAERLLPDVVRIRAIDLQEHGFGLVVGATARHVFVATARHVVAARAPTAPPRRGAAAGRIERSFCAGDGSAPVLRAAELVDGFDAGGQDLALLRDRKSVV